MDEDTRQKIDRFLGANRAGNRACPIVKKWVEFHKLLLAHRPAAADKPPVPYILGGIGAPNAVKHARLRQQLEWAAANGCFPAAIAFLETLKDEDWFVCRLELWESPNIF
ncbi:MAG: hypothetical protein NW216_11075 [Hyphomicrobium sp.]|nr:hypothetical protein [Hyphomicrobium sp.]